MVVHNQLFLVAAPSCTWLSAKYDVMRCPSAYCATSSGIDMLSMRVSTQPAWPSLVRTRLQSSMWTTAACEEGSSAFGVSGFGFSSDFVFGTERASQLLGAVGAAGVGGGGTRASSAFCFECRRDVRGLTTFTAVGCAA